MSVWHGKDEAGGFESNSDVLSKSISHVEDAAHHRGAEDVTGFDLVSGVDGEGVLKLGIFEADQVGLGSPAHLLKEATEVAEHFLRGIGKDKGATVEVLVEVGDEKQPVKNRDVVGLSVSFAVPPRAAFFGIDLGELQIGFPVGSLDQVLGAVAIR